MKKLFDSNRMFRRALGLLAFVPSLVLAQPNQDVDFIRPMDTLVNSRFEEIAPLMAPDNVLYFARALHPENRGGEPGGQDIWMARLEQGAWTPATNKMPRLNDYFNNAVVGITDDGKTLFLLGSYSGKYEFQGGVSRSTLTENGWGKPKLQKVKNLNTRAMFNSYYVDGSGRVMIIGITDKSGENEDLYVSFYEGRNKWSEPISLGPHINTEGDEFAPFLSSPDLLYFSSNGRGGLGDADIFYSRRLDDSWQNWSEPKNAGTPINSEAFDAYFSQNGRRAFFSSNRNGDFSDIYEIAFVEVEFEEEEATASSKGQMMVMDLVGQAFSDAGTVSEVYLTNMEGDTLEKLPVNNGTFKIAKIPDNQDYMLRLPSGNADALRSHTLMLKQSGENIMLYPSVEYKGFLFTMRNSEIAAVMTQQEDEVEFVFDYQALNKEGVTVTLYDENDNPIETVTLETSGRFAFRKLEKDKHYYMKINAEDVNLDEAKLFVMNSSGAMLEMDPATLAKDEPFKMVDESQFKVPPAQEEAVTEESGEKFQFDYSKLPPEGMRVNLYDENDNLIETAIVDSEGNFEFKKLDRSQNFYIRTEEEIDLSEMKFYAVGDNGEKVKLDSRTLEGEFAYRKLNQGVFAALAMVEAEDTHLEYTAEDNEEYLERQRFSFTYNNLPVAGTRIGLYDENDNLIEIAIVDSEGYYEFKKLDPTRNYYMKIEEKDMDLNLAKMYAVSQSGEMQEITTEDESTFVFKALKAEESADIALEEAEDTELKYTLAEEENPNDLSRFSFTYTGLPSELVRINLYDENNNLIGTAVVDSEGYFVFRKLKPDHNYHMSVEADDIDMAQVKLYEVDESGNKVPLFFSSEDGYFTYNTLDSDSAVVAMVNESDALFNYKNEIAKRFAFTYNSLPGVGTMIGLYDENGLLVEMTIVDSLGFYDFKELDRMENYIVKIEAEDMDLDLVKLYSVDKDGKQTELPLQLDAGFFTYNQVTEAEEVVVEENIAVQEPVKEEAPAVKETIVQPEGKVKEEAPVKPVRTGTEPDFIALYGFNEVFPNPSTHTILYQALKGLRSDAGLSLLIVGHTDDKGSNEVNQRVGMMRAKYAKHYFTSRGIADIRIETTTKGETEPVAPNDTEDNRAKNRRVEIFVR